jgi:hypothetical protein
VSWVGRLVDRWIWANRSFPSEHPPEVLIARLEKQADATTDYEDTIGLCDVAYRLKGNQLRLRFRHPAPTEGVLSPDFRTVAGGRGTLRRDFYGEIVGLSTGSVIIGSFRWQTYFWMLVFFWVPWGIVEGMPQYSVWVQGMHPNKPPVIRDHYYFPAPAIAIGFLIFLIIHQMNRSRVCQQGAEDFLTHITTDP